MLTEVTTSSHTNNKTNNFKMADWEEPHLSVVRAFNVEVTGYKGHMVDPTSREVGNVWHLHINLLWERRASLQLILMTAN